MNCVHCDSQLPEKAFFCPKCRKQVKCKHCNEELFADSPICISCGEEIGQKISSLNMNTIEFSESETERKLKATFTDTVGQSITDSLGLLLTNKIGTRVSLPVNRQIINENNSKNEVEEITAEIIENNEKISQKSSIPLEIPTLKEVKLRDLAKTETDWIVVYSLLRLSEAK